MSGIFLEGAPAEITLQTGELAVTVQGQPVEKAQRQPVTEENVRKQLGKMGDSVFVPENMNLCVGEDVFYPIGQINELRREAVSGLERSLLERNGYGGQRCGGQFPEADTKKSDGAASLPQENAKAFKKEPEAKNVSQDCLNTDRKAFGNDDGGVVIGIRTLEQLQAVAEEFSELMKASEDNDTVQKVGYPAYRLKRLYVDGDLLLDRTRETVELCGKTGAEPSIFIALPHILRKRDDGYLASLSETMEQYPEFCGVLARSLDGLAYALKKGYHNRLDANVYCWNSLAWEELKAETAGFCLPLELKAGEQRKLLDRCGNFSGAFEKTVYGRIPMMVTANCLSKTIWGCRPGKGERTDLIDRYQKEFPVIINCKHCMNIIYNSVPLSLHQDMERWSETTDVRLDFTIESGTETEQILRAFVGGGELPYREYTTGHEKRGVE